MLNQAFIQDDFYPEDIPFRTLPTMSETVLQTMLPGMEGKSFTANLHEGKQTPFIVVFYHQSSERHPGHTARAQPITRWGKVRTGDQTTASPMP
jgi:hypothetical protein